MQSATITAIMRLLSQLTQSVFSREERQMLISGGSSMIALLLVGTILACLALSLPAEPQEISLNAATQDQGDTPFVWQSSETPSEDPSTSQPQASQQELLAAEPVGGNLVATVEDTMARLLASNSASKGSSAEASESLAGVQDPFNPSASGLARQGMFSGRKLLAWTNEPYVIRHIFPDTHPLWQVLRSMGFEVQIKTGRFNKRDLIGISQLWIFSGMRPGMTGPDYRAVKDYLYDGGGLYLCADNTPYTIESRRLCALLFGCEPKGDYFGYNDKPRILQGPDGEIQISEKNWQDRHALLTGIQCIFEGHTISTLPDSQRMIPVLRASNQRVLAAVSRNPKIRVVVDGGFTRYVAEYNVRGTEKGAGTMLWATNVAAYLEGVE